jgi:tetratricopeptide (TPR) repeat protein
MKYRFSYLVFILLFACQPKQQQTNASKTAGQLPKIINELSSALNRFPDSVGLRFKLVDALDSVGKYNESLVQIDSLISKDAGNFGLWFKKALVLTHKKDTSNAISAYLNALKIYPSPDALLAVANLYAELKDPKALSFCKQVAALQLGRTYLAHCQFITGIYYARIGNTIEAIQFFNQCISNNYLYMEAYMEKGFLYFDQHKTKEALMVFQTVVTLKNNYADGYYWMAKCYEVFANQSAAIDNYQKALTLDSSIKEAEDAITRLKKGSGI